MKRNQNQDQETKKTTADKAIERSAFDPIAIVAMAFKLPQDCATEHDFWQGLKQGRDFITKVPSDRWAVDELQHDKRSEPGRSVTFAAGVLSGLDKFDADFFGISPREAAMVDPQHRLLLELSWEAMENGGYLPSQLAGSDCAVYIGISGLDYGTRMLDDCAMISAHTMTGNTLSIAANRLSYFFDFRGPSLAVDTACSSSLVALHHACSSLHTGEASMALVGGVNMLLHPYPFIGFTKASMLSASGRCKAFDASADGYVRSEGGAVFLLKPLKTALQDGDEVQAVILGTGINADGSRKSGITIPSAEGQADLMRTVLAKAGIAPADVDFVEAHGTGTLVGDPIEAYAIGEVYGKNRLAPLPIGSVKANIGHLEPAAGVAGLVKTVLALKNRALPPALHLTKPNPHINFSQLNLELVTDYKNLSTNNNKPLIAGINSFGFGGANAHMIVQEFNMAHKPAITLKQRVAEHSALPPLFLSAKTDDALSALALKYHALLQHKTVDDYYDIAYSTVNYRQAMDKSFAIQPSSYESLLNALRLLSEGDFPANAVIEDAIKQTGDVAFIYSGNGAQWFGMCQTLMKQSLRFSEILTTIDAILQPFSGFSVIKELSADIADTRQDDTAVAQPLLFAIQVAVTLLLKEQGVEPKAVAGHSVGEVAAAWAAGVFNLKQAAQLICARSKAQALTKGAGRMAAVSLSEHDMLALLDTFHDKLDIEIAGINSPHNITLSGDINALKLIQKHLKSKGIFFKLLDIDYAFHSRHMDSIKDVLQQSLSGLKPTSSSQITFVSAVTGLPIKAKLLDADYWWQNIRLPVKFAGAVDSLIKANCRIFIEIGPHAILQRYLNECIAATDVEARVLPTLINDKQHGIAQIEQAALRTHIQVGKPQDAPYFSHHGQRVRLPNYPWQRERHWNEKTAESDALLERRRRHPILGWRLNKADAHWENTVDTNVLPWLADHQVGGAVVFPGSAYIELALAAAREWLGEKQYMFEELDIITPIVFDNDHARTLRFTLNQRDGTFQILSKQRLSQDSFSLHATGRILEATTKQQATRIKATPASATVINKQEHYALTTRLGLNYGAAFQGLKACRISGNSLEADVNMPTAIDAEDGYLIHPAMLDLCFQSLVDFFRDEIMHDRGIAFLPIKVGRLNYYSAVKPIQFKARLKRFSKRSLQADFELFDVDENLVASLTDCRFRSVPLMQRKNEAITHWETVPVLRPHPFDRLSSHFHDVKQIVHLLQQATSASDTQRQTWFKETLPLLEALTVSYAYEAFQKTARKHNINRLIKSNQSPFLVWLSNLLIKENLLVQVNDKWQIAVDLEVPNSAEIWQYLQSTVPTTSPQLLLMGRVGERLPALITGELDGKSYQAILEKSLSTQLLYDNDPAYVEMLNAIEQAILAMAQQIAAGQKIRILEITAGPSTLPRRLLSKLSPDQLDYVIAATDEHVAEYLQADYQTVTNLTIAQSNLTSGELTADKAMPAVFDIIVVRHSLHQFSDPQTYIKQTAKRLTKGGIALIAERYPDANADLIAGIDPSWWYIDETPEGNIKNVMSPLLPPEAWVQALIEYGFDDVEYYTEKASSGLAQGAYLLIAKQTNDVVIHATETQARTWLFIADNASNGIANQLKAILESQSQTVIITDSTTNIQTEIDHVISLLGWDATVLDTTNTLNQAVQTVQQIVASNKPASLWFITKGGALCNHSPINAWSNPAQAALWGFGRVVMNEYAILNCKMIDIGIQDHANNLIERITHELLNPDGADEIILSDTARYCLQMQEKQPLVAVNSQEEQTRYYLDFLTAGQLRNLVWLTAQKQLLQDNQVEVETKAVGLNFRDIMYLMGLLPDEAVENGFAGASLGLEFAGVVTRVGKDVNAYTVGQSVMGFGASCFGSHVVTRHDAIAPMPNSWTFEAAATVPTTFFTVYYALKHLADIQPGEKVLIHGAAGGVGIAAIQLAQHLGAEIFATAGSEEKRDFVRLLGANHVFDSRSLDFADDIAAMTDGEGVDVILNSLAGEAIRRNLSILKPFGRFLELGKRDFFENTPVGLRPFKDNISYFGIDADQLLINRPALAHQLFQEVMDLFAAGIFTPLPHRVFDANAIVDAFRVMQQARHIGKVVISLDNAKPTIQHEKQAQSAPKLHANSTWLITGGLSGFGLESAKALITHGVKNIALVSRRGMQTPGATAAVAEMKLQGINVLVLSCDIADKAQLSAALNQVQKQMPPLTGILHAAMVIDDQLISNLNEANISTVITPKLVGAWHLHTLTQTLPLAHFILYSSITTFIGNPGQANYVAANAGLECLAAMRKHQGLPANCIGWGPIADAGYLTRNQMIKESLGKRLGNEPMLVKQALQQLDAILSAPNNISAIANFDWRVLSKVLPSASAVRFNQLNSTLSGINGVDSSIDFQTMIAGKNRVEVTQVVTDMIIYEVSAILCMSADRIHPRRSLHDLGMDSLMAVELALGLERRFGIQLPVMMLNESPNAEKVALRIVEKVLGEEQATHQDSAIMEVEQLVKQHGEQLSAAEMNDVIQDFSKLNQANAE